MRFAWISAVLLMVIGLGPVAGPWVARGIAGIGGCSISVTFPQPCVILGMDWGPSLHALFSTGWLMFATAPAALVGMAMGIGLAVVTLVRRARE